MSTVWNEECRLGLMWNHLLKAISHSFALEKDWLRLLSGSSPDFSLQTPPPSIHTEISAVPYISHTAIILHMLFPILFLSPSLILHLILRVRVSDSHVMSEGQIVVICSLLFSLNRCLSWFTFCFSPLYRDTDSEKQVLYYK